LFSVASVMPQQKPNPQLISVNVSVSGALVAPLSLLPQH